MSDRKLDIKIISDNICPFCYLGKKKIEAAVAQLGPDVTVTYDWLPFELDPTLPTTSVDKLARYRAKFGAERIGPMLTAMKANGARWGINFDYGGKIGNTFNSHRLVEFSKTPAGGSGRHTDALMNSLFESYFTQQGDIASEDMLVAAARKAALPASEEQLRTFLRGNELRDKVRSEINEAQAAEITGVPHFIFNDKIAVSGAQEPETFLAVFKKLGFTPAAAAAAPAKKTPATATDGATCDPNKPETC